MSIQYDSNASWEPWFAWKTVTLVNGKRVWLKSIYRKKISTLNGGRTRGMWVESYWIYGTIIDVLGGK